MTISGGCLRLSERSADNKVSHPIDHFLKSLASDTAENSVAVILSGTGSDGSRGIRNIHDAGGIVLAQDVESARFDGMPKSAKATGIVDRIGPPSELAIALQRFSNQSVSSKSSRNWAEVDEVPLRGVERVFQLLNRQHGLDFSLYKASTVGRRIQRRLDLLRVSSIEQYIQRLESDPEELDNLYRDLLIGVTKFFRDPEAFDVLSQRVIRNLFTPPVPETIRVWVAGCASGQEAYSIAMLIDEEIRRREIRPEVKIFATDVHELSLATAARGIYSEESLAELSTERRQYYFREHRDGYHVTRELRKYIVFASHNLVSDAAFTQLDLVCCRNLLIYLETQAQQKTLSLFHFSLRTNGFLFLGPSESLGNLANEFTVIDKRWRIFSKRRNVRLPVETRIPLGNMTDRLRHATPRLGSQTGNRVDGSLLRTYDRLLDRKMPPSILIGDDYEIIHIFGGAEKYLKTRGGRPSNALPDQIDPELRTAVVGAVHHAERRSDRVRLTGSYRFDDAMRSFQISVEPIKLEVEEPTRFLVEIEETAAACESEIPEAVDLDDASQRRVAELESELRHTRENLQATVEEMETSNEELQASNEELVASNEELQSTNEELHSVNEELYTVNAEHQRRVEELAEANADMDNLLATTRVGVIFLDEELCIRRFTPEIGRLFNLVPHDLGRSIDNFTSNLSCDALGEDLQQVLDTQKEKEFEVQDRTGTPFLVRVLPYRSSSKILGVVMTLIDISNLKDAERQLERFKFMTESAVDPIILVDLDGRITYANAATADLVGHSLQQLQKLSLTDLDPSMGPDAFRQAANDKESQNRSGCVSSWKHQESHEIPVEVSTSRVDFQGTHYRCLFVRDITQRVIAEREMRLRNKAIEAAMNGIIITDASEDDNPITYANPGFVSLTGYPLEEIVGRNCRFLQGEQTDRETIRKLREAIDNGVPIRLTIHNYRKDGTPFWNDLQITPVYDDQNKLINFVGIQHDVTRQINAQAIANDHLQRIAAILDSAAEGIYGIDFDGRCTFCNESALQMFGYEEKEMIGRTMHQLVHHSHADGSPLPVEDCKIVKAFRGQRSTHVSDEVFWKKDGKPFPVEYWSQPLIQGGAVVGAVVSFQDITERLALSTRLEQMGEMIDASSDAIIAWELNGTIVSWNHGATQLYGYRADEAIGQITRELLATVHPRPWKEIYQSLLETGEWVGTLEHTTQAGQKVIVSSRHQFLDSGDGRQQVLEINRDITKQIEIQKELERANRAAEEANAAKSAFLANISHELRTPMTAVLGFADILRMETESPDQTEKVDTIKRNGEYLLALLNDILDLSKIEAGKLSFHRQSVDLQKLVTDVCSLMNIRAADEGIPLSFEWTTPVPRKITADRIRLRQILVNLIGNAIKFTDDGYVKVLISLEPAGGEPHGKLQDATEAHLNFSVLDTGIGMTPEQQSQLFTPFSQPSQNDNSQIGGTGLGLTISKRLAEGMGGFIQVASERGKGSRFTLVMPVKKDQLQDLVSLGQASSRRAKKSKTKMPEINSRILLADDRRDVWRIGKYFLEKCGATVTIVEDGRQAVDEAMRALNEGDPYAAILMDMQMPVMNGREAVAELRQKGFDEPIIALTADAMAGEREACIKIGCNEYFPKPIDGPKLMNMLADLLNQHQQS